MNVDASIVKAYLQGKDDYAEHWIFFAISGNGEYTFELPDLVHKEAIREILERVEVALNNFEPYNIDLFSALFPRWRELISDANVILSVGSPAPYDAMVREYNGKEYMIFDLIRFLDYQKDGADILSMIRQLVTHEAAHICIHADYPKQPMYYDEALTYITFDEGFAHLLSFSEELESYDFEPMIQAHYQKVRNRLKAALSEEDPEKQEEYLQASNCGAYWDKFAAISGKLNIASHLKDINKLYQGGPDKLLSAILK